MRPLYDTTAPLFSASTFSAKKWIEITGAKGLIASAGVYVIGGD
jgi:hypothetical protein